MCRWLRARRVHLAVMVLVPRHPAIHAQLEHRARIALEKRFIAFGPFLALMATALSFPRHLLDVVGGHLVLRGRDGEDRPTML